MFANDIQEKGENWQLLLYLIDIVDFVTDPSVTKQSCEYLNGLVYDFLDVFCELHPNSVLTPNMHFMTHYANQMIQFGPLSNFWTLRFESKHSYFKDISRSTKNLKNITYTLAKRHQMLQSILMSTSGVLGKENTLPLQGRMTKTADLPVEISACIFEVTGVCDEVYVSQAVQDNGMSYDTGACVILDVVERICQFGLIKLWFFHLSQCYFIVQEMDTDCFGTDCHAYIVMETNRKLVVQSTSFIFHNALPLQSWYKELCSDEI